jgi:DNA-binding transcriptional regulator YiaG
VNQVTPITDAPNPDAMPAAELARVLDQLGLSQPAAARLLRVESRSLRRWAEGHDPVPLAAARFLRSLARSKTARTRALGTTQVTARVKVTAPGAHYGARHHVSPAEIRRLLHDLDLSQVDAAALLGVNDRTMRRWTSGSALILPVAARFLRFLAKEKISPVTVMKLLEA